jgi:two-component system sensor kinase FixL
LQEREVCNTIVETASDAIIIIDEQSTILFANRATERIFGYREEELVGQQLTILMPDYLRQVHKQAIHGYVETGKKHLLWVQGQYEEAAQEFQAELANVSNHVQGLA